MTAHHLFIVTSAINTRFGVFNDEERLHQTLETVESIKQHIPDASILLVEMSAVPLSDKQKNFLSSAVNQIVYFSGDPDVQNIYKNDNWDVVKNLTEVMCFQKMLGFCNTNHLFDKFDRIHKISGRYFLNKNFNKAIYEDCSKIILVHKKKSQFSFDLTGVKYQFMSRFWSWPKSLTSEVIKTYKDGFIYMYQRISQNGYCDIEHMLYKHLPQELIHTVDKIGIEGMLGQNGIRIDD